MVEKTFIVPDVSCEHCVRAITSELTQIDGVEQVSVDIPTKVVTVRASDAVTDAVLVAGLSEAGYEVASPS
ncbi:MAG TPA: heavy-metal-associated domain-containing protein [Thermomicrobiales bacterium]|jgi:copper chaperone CopZ|nr:copper-binding protein [Chloroflexota bacterium]HQZ89786.1 heavy-metal-associated domain-containing protein [Thermomicrobiales bacterium]HRA30488.1 heavy-metal-associated domain-containing protein [Thermomicrobiales bacterium]